MNAQAYTAPLADTKRFPGEAEEPLAMWTLDELSQYADLDSVRSAWAGTDSPGSQWVG